METLNIINPPPPVSKPKKPTLKDVFKGVKVISSKKRKVLKPVASKPKKKK